MTTATRLAAVSAGSAVLLAGCGGTSTLSASSPAPHAASHVSGSGLTATACTNAARLAAWPNRLGRGPYRAVIGRAGLLGSRPLLGSFRGWGPSAPDGGVIRPLEPMRDGFSLVVWV